MTTMILYDSKQQASNIITYSFLQWMCTS